MANSIQKPLTSQFPINKLSENKINELLKEIIIDFSEVMDDHLFSEAEISTDSNTLSDEFLKPSFDKSILRKYFDEDAWLAFCNLLSTKITLSTCNQCKVLCLEKCIECTKCMNWVHFDCDSISFYFRSGKGNYKCNLCKIKKRENLIFSN